MKKKEVYKKHAKSIAAILLLCSFFVFALVALKIYLHGKFLPSLTFAGSKISHLSDFEIDEKIAEEIRLTEEATHKVSIGSQSKLFTGLELGVVASFEETKKSLSIFDAREDGIADLIYKAALENEKDLIYSIDVERAAKELEAKFDIANNRAKNAGLERNEKGEIIIIPETEGEIINRVELKTKIQNTVEGKSDNLALEVIRELPSLSTEELKSQKKLLEKTLERPIKLNYKRQSWSFVPIERLNWLQFSQGQKIDVKGILNDVPISDSLNINSNEIHEVKPYIVSELTEDFERYIEEEIAKDIDTKMQSAKLYYNEDGKVIIEGSAADGEKIHTQRLREMASLAINEGISSLEMPVKIVKAEVETDKKLREQGVKELVSIGHTTFFGSPANRHHNIAVGMRRFNGVTIKQGEVFSFNKLLGVVDGSTGYREELVIKGDEGTVPEYGGGLCQDSTTFYRAALMGGLEVIQRRPHSYAVSYYAQTLGHGLDATIYPGVSDLRFINDTPGDIVVQSYASGGHAFVKFYGTADGRSTKLEGPYISNRKSAPPDMLISTNELAPGVRKKKENAHNGFDTTWYYYLTKDGKTTKQTIFSNYKAVPARILVGAEKEQALSGEPEA